MGTIDLIPPPESLPANTDDYAKQNALIQQLLLQYNLKTLYLTNWGTTSKPQIKQGVSIHHGGSQFIVNTSDVDISGAPADGRVYVKLTRAGDQLQASFTNDASGFVWDYIYNGFYDTGGDQLLPVIIIKKTIDWYKFDLEGSENKYDIAAQLHKTKVIDIGDWNMETTTYINLIPIGIPREWVRSLAVLIRGDDPSSVLDITPLDYIYINPPDTSVAQGGFEIAALSDAINLARLEDGIFDNANFDQTSYNRGWITINYSI